MIDMCGTAEQLAVDTICAPRLVIPACSALEPNREACHVVEEEN